MKSPIFLSSLFLFALAAPLVAQEPTKPDEPEAKKSKADEEKSDKIKVIADESVSTEDTVTIKGQKVMVRRERF